MNLDYDCKFEYVVNHEAWYFLPRPDAEKSGGFTGRDINVCSAAHGGGVAWEFSVQEYRFGKDQVSVRVCVFDDAFKAYAQVPEFFEVLATERPKSLAAVQQVLDRLGARDATSRRHPTGQEPARQLLVEAVRTAERALAAYDEIRSS